jgi:hypothetical protein
VTAGVTGEPGRRRSGLFAGSLYRIVIWVHSGAMFVAPVPSQGDIFVGRDAVGRVLRVSAHPELDRVVLSIWQEGRCMGTLRLASDDVPDLVRTLTAAVISDPRPSWAAG